MKGWVGNMEEKDMDKEFERLKKGIGEGWLFSEDDEYEIEEDDLPENKESLFEKYNKEKIESDK